MNVLAFYLALSGLRPNIAVDSILWTPGAEHLTVVVYVQRTNRYFHINVYLNMRTDGFDIRLDATNTEINRPLLDEEKWTLTQVRNKLFLTAHQQAKLFLDKHQVSVVHYSK